MDGRVLAPSVHANPESDVAFPGPERNEPELAVERTYHVVLSPCHSGKFVVYQVPVLIHQGDPEDDILIDEYRTGGRVYEELVDEKGVRYGPHVYLPDTARNEPAAVEIAFHLYGMSSVGHVVREEHELVLHRTIQCQIHIVLENGIDPAVYEQSAGKKNTLARNGKGYVALPREKGRGIRKLYLNGDPRLFLFRNLRRRLFREEYPHQLHLAHLVGIAVRVVGHGPVDKGFETSLRYLE